jgi:hypothetical protein
MVTGLNHPKTLETSVFMMPCLQSENLTSQNLLKI